MQKAAVFNGVVFILPFLELLHCAKYTSYIIVINSFITRLSRNAPIFFLFTGMYENYNLGYFTHSWKQIVAGYKKKLMCFLFYLNVNYIYHLKFIFHLHSTFYIIIYVCTIKITNKLLFYKSHSFDSRQIQHV